MTMAGFNRIIMMGNLTRDPELRQLPSGNSVCRLGLAANRSYKNRQTGDMVEEVCFVDVDVWGAQAESCNQYLSKGRPVLVEGRLKLDSWQDQEGNNRSKHSIVADRVVFMPSAMQSDDTFADNTQSRSKEEENLLKEVEEKASRAQKKAQSAKAEKVEDDLVPNKGELNLKDEPPFQDDLPF
jgi:single-strand DNA-binding protein